MVHRNNAGPEVRRSPTAAPPSSDTSQGTARLNITLLVWATKFTIIKKRALEFTTKSNEMIMLFPSTLILYILCIDPQTIKQAKPLKELSDHKKGPRLALFYLQFYLCLTHSPHYPAPFSTSRLHQSLQLPTDPFLFHVPIESFLFCVCIEPLL